ncbi:MAG: DUF2303 family protein [Ectothiorhodospiraceae bacterium]|nr:DUF2303 family protein [Ectothiorhodospiraceae bacterium]
MTMDRSAIERIEELSNGGTLGTHIPSISLPGGNKVESLEQFQERPARNRTRFTTERLPDWLAYVTDHAPKPGAAAFVRPDGSGATGIMDFGTHETPQWCDHRAVLTMKHTPEFAALLEACSSALSQRDLTDWLEDWRDIITPFEDEEEVSVAQAVAAIRKVDIKQAQSSTHEQADYRASVSSIAEIDARSASGSLPTLFTIWARVYPSTTPCSIQVRPSLLTGDSTPRFRLRIMAEARLMEDVANEVQQDIRDQLAESVPVYLGSV